jgi:hypothetical protein
VSASSPQEESTLSYRKRDITPVSRQSASPQRFKASFGKHSKMSASMIWLLFSLERRLVREWVCQADDAQITKILTRIASSRSVL